MPRCAEDPVALGNDTASMRAIGALALLLAIRTLEALA